MFNIASDNVKMVKGKAPNEGIAMYRNTKGEWGTVCDKRFNINGWAQVMCRELGYDHAIEVRYENLSFV